MPSALARCGRLLLVAVLLWCALAGPAWAVAGKDGLLGLSIAAGLCTIPGLIVFAAAGLFAPGASQAAFIAMGGTLLRLVFVLVGAMAVQAVNSKLRLREFLVWLLAYYLVMLLSETLLIVKPAKTGSN